MAALLEPYLPLYLKHRPQSLGQLVGQRTVVKTLTNAIDNDRIAHAYLFTGPRGTGKTSSARILAKSLNCENGPTADPCMKCTMCEEIKKGISPAVMEIDAASNNSVDDARVLIERAPLVAQGGRFKLYIIDECHMLTKEAFNALLKTIEEPPPKVIFILATTEEHKVPPTIVSRCQRLMFRLVNHEELSAHLRNIADIEKIAIEDEALELIARRSGGGLRDALGLLDQASLLATPEKPVGIKDLLVLLGAIEEDVLINISEGIANRDAEAVLSSAHQLLAQGREPSLVALELAKHFLNLAKGMHLSKTKSSGGQGEQVETSLAQQLIMGSQSYIQRVIELSKTFEAAELTQIVAELDRLEQTLRRSTQPSLALEIGLLSVCHRHDILLVKELAQKVEYLESAIAGGAPPPAHNVSHHAPQAPAHQAAVHHAPTAPAPAPKPTPAPNPVPAPVPTPAPVSAPAPAAAAAIPTTVSHPAPAPSPSSAPAAEPDYTSTATNGASGHSVHEDLAQPPPRVPARDTFEVNDDGDVEPSASSGAVDSDDVEGDESPSSSPAPAVATGSASSPATVATSGSGAAVGDSGNSEDLDEFWSNLMSDLQTRHLPSFSLVSQFGFPLSLRQDELVIGVLKDNFQKMIEGKAEQIKTSAKIISGRELFIKVRVTADEAPPPRPQSSGGKSHGGPGAANRGQAQEKTSLPSASSRQEAGDDEPGEPAAAGASHASALRAATAVEERPAAAPNNAPSYRSPSPSGEPSKPSAADLSRPISEAEGGSGDNQLMVKEAYKLFEGPGSRRVG